MKPGEIEDLTAVVDRKYWNARLMEAQLGMKMVAQKCPTATPDGGIWTLMIALTDYEERKICNTYGSNAQFATLMTATIQKWIESLPPPPKDE
jgi:hypothetical protein